MTGPVYVVVPDDIDDPELPSGGNAYDRRVCSGLAAAGRTVHELAAGGTWPRPDAGARASLARSLAALPDGAAVLLDGLVACGVPDVVVPQSRRLRLIVLVHLPLEDEVGSAPGLAHLERQTLRAAAAVVATSEWSARRLAGLYGLDRVLVAAPGVDPAPVTTAGHGGRLLSVGSVTPTKGHDVLVDALAQLADLPWTCTVVGPTRRDRGHLAAVRGAIERHGLGGRITVRGPLPATRLAAEYAAADLLVLPSRAETYGMVVTEALARGVPVLATAVGGVPDTLGRDRDGRVPGVLVPPADATALAGALRRWFGDPALRAGLRRSAVARRDDLQRWETTVNRLAEIVEPGAAQRPAARPVAAS